MDDAEFAARFEAMFRETYLRAVRRVSDKRERLTPEAAAGYRFFWNSFVRWLTTAHHDAQGLRQKAQGGKTGRYDADRLDPEIAGIAHGFLSATCRIWDAHPLRASRCGSGT